MCLKVIDSCDREQEYIQVFQNVETIFSKDRKLERNFQPPQQRSRFMLLLS